MNDPRLLLINPKKICGKQDKIKTKKKGGRKILNEGGILGKYGKKKKEEKEGKKMFGKFWTPNQNLNISPRTTTTNPKTKRKKTRDDSVFKDPTKYVKAGALYIPVEALKREPHEEIDLFKQFAEGNEPIDFLKKEEEEPHDNSYYVRGIRYSGEEAEKMYGYGPGGYGVDIDTDYDKYYLSQDDGEEDEVVLNDEEEVLEDYIKLLRKVPVKDEDEWRCPGCGKPIPYTAQECAKFYCENESTVDKIKEIIKNNNINVRKYASVDEAFDVLKKYL